MPQAPSRPCRKPGCPALVTAHGYCDKHQDQIKQADRYRGSAHERGYGHEWRVKTAQFRKDNPLCVHCLANGRVKAMKVVDHTIPHKGDKALMWDQTNWQALCESCHNRKTASQDMGAWIPAAKK